LHQSPSQLLLDLGPANGDANSPQQQGAGAAAAALLAEALSPIVPIPRRSSSVAALSDCVTEGESNGTDVDLSEVHDMVDQIQRNLAKDLREISTSINNNDNTNTATNADDDDDDDANGDNEGSFGTCKAENDDEEESNNCQSSQISAELKVDPEAASFADEDEPSKKSTDSIEDKANIHMIDTPDSEPSSARQEGEAYQSAETSATPSENDQEAERLQPSICQCMCHNIPSSRDEAPDEDKIETRTLRKYPIPDRESAGAPARALCQTANEIQSRAEIAGVMASMVTDIEQAHWLATDLRHRSEVFRLQNQFESAQRMLSERQLVEQSEQERRKEVGDRLLVEIMSLGATLADTENYRIERDQVSDENQLLISQLASARDQIIKIEAERDDALAAALRDRSLVELEEMKKKEKEQKANFDEDWVSLKEEVTSKEEPAELVDAQPPRAKESGRIDGSPPRVKSTDFGVFVVEDRDRDQDQEQDVGGKSRALEGEEELLPASLLMLPERELMALFSFLEAEEILSVAELNMLMYSRVDALFGIGAEASNQEEVAGNNRDREEDLSTPTFVEVPPPPPSGPDEGAGRPIEAQEAVPTIGLAGQAQEGAHLIGSALGNAVSNLLWQRNLLREHNTSTSGFASSLTTSAHNEFSENDAISHPQSAGTAEADSDEAKSMNHRTSSPLLTAGLASKIASKLSPEELSVIIQMRTKINQLEEERVKGKERQDDLMAELRGIEGVKDFLVTKLRDAERSKTAKIDDAERTAKQVASDQEVIGFLDNKVGELETQCTKLAAEREKLKEELTEIRKDGKIRFLEDQLKFMRDEVADHGKQWKVEKKILVKEIKENRHKLAVLEAEKRGLQSEVTRLKTELRLPWDLKFVPQGNN